MILSELPRGVSYDWIPHLLCELDLSGIHLDRSAVDSIVSVLRDHVDVSTLILNPNGDPKEAGHVADLLSRGTHLKSVRVGSTAFRTMIGLQLADSTRCNALFQFSETLDLSLASNIPRSELSSCLRVLQENTFVSTVGLDNQILDCTTIQTLGDVLDENVRVVHLSLENCTLNDNQASESLGQILKRNKRLTTINLNGVGGTDLDALAASLSQHPKIRTVGLGPPAPCLPIGLRVAVSHFFHRYN